MTPPTTLKDLEGEVTGLNATKDNTVAVTTKFIEQCAQLEGCIQGMQENGRITRATAAAALDTLKNGQLQLFDKGVILTGEVSALIQLWEAVIVGVIRENPEVAEILESTGQAPEIPLEEGIITMIRERVKGVEAANAALITTVANEKITLAKVARGLTSGSSVQE